MTLRGCSLTLALLVLSPGAAAQDENGDPEPGAEVGPELDDDPDELRAKLERLEDRLATSDARRQRLEERLAEVHSDSKRSRRALQQKLEEALYAERRERRRLAARLAALEEEASKTARSHDFLTKRVKEMEAVYPTRAVEEPADQVKLGGAVWLNYAYRSFQDSDRERGGELTFDLFRLSVDGSMGGVLVSAQYRFYSYMQAIHHAWLGYGPTSHVQLRAGVTAVPFGILPFASHSYFFGIPFYLGLADDYDLGVRVVYDREPWNLQVGVYKNAEPAIGDAVNRFSFDAIAPADDPAGATEANQVAARASYLSKLGPLRLELGLSGRAGGLYGADDRVGYQWAVAGHASAFLGQWNAQLEGIRYAFERNDQMDGIDPSLVTLGAFASSRRVAARGTVAVINVARRFAVDWGKLEEVRCYQDFSALFKSDNRFENSWLTTTGCLLVAGPVYTYLDLIAGENATFLGDDGEMSGLGVGSPGDDIELRANVNVEYFF